VKDRSRRLKLERLKVSLQKGTYVVDPQLVAAAILCRGLERLRAAAS
jgi:anti-sigma28 factor (negative regulator of flagellin synthesis)